VPVAGHGGRPSIVPVAGTPGPPAAPGLLPRTGAGIAGLVLAAVVLLVAGSGAIASGRRARADRGAR
jgi:hypothetical protein